MRYFYVPILLSLLLANTSFSQKKYWTTGGDFIFSFAKIDSAGKHYDNIMRFSCFFHLQEQYHVDLTDKIGLFSGIGVRNVGFIYDHHDIKTKVRSYALGIPIAVKFGNLDKDFYVYAGAELEWMFNFKRKDFANGEKTIKTAWFSSETNPLIPSVFLGFQFKKGLNIKFKYYLSNFLNPSYNDRGIQPYKNLNTQMFYISLGYQFRNKKAKSLKRNTFNAHLPMQTTFF